MSAEALPQTPSGSLQRCPRPSSYFQEGRFAAGGQWRAGLGGGEKRGREGKGEMGKGEEKREVGDSALVVGG